MRSPPKPPSGPPATRLKIQPGENIWAAMARELAQRPDGPVALNVQSMVNAALLPRQKAVQGVVNALMRQLQAPDAPGVQAGVATAVVHWEAICGQTLDEAQLADFRQAAATAIERRRKQPPAMAFILQPGPDGQDSLAGRTDIAYDKLGLLDGLQGTWHRLWGAISLARQFDFAADDGLIPTLRAEFEGLLGRAMSAAEWDLLVLDAHWHCDQVARPLTDKLPVGGAPGPGARPR